MSFTRNETIDGIEFSLPKHRMGPLSIVSQLDSTAPGNTLTMPARHGRLVS